MSDAPPMPFARVPAMWEPVAPLYINAQDAAFTIRELATPPARNAPSDVYESLLQSALQVGLTTQEMQDFVRRAMREFGYSNARAIPRVGRQDNIKVVAGFIDCWSALQSQYKTSPGAPGYTVCSAVVVNHILGGGGFASRLMEEVRDGARRAGAQVRVAGDSDLTALARPIALKRAVANLVANASAHGEHVELSARPRPSGGVEIVVDDDGPGIPEDRYEDAFKAFNRLDEARNQNTKGVGLGLAIARDVARGLGGDLVLDRSPLGGLRAVVRLPG